MYYRQRNLTLANTVHKLNQIDFQPQQKSCQPIIQNFIAGGLKNPTDLHWLYVIVKCLSAQQRIQFIVDIPKNITSLIFEWIRLDSIQAMGLKNYLSLRSIEEIIQLIDLEMQQNIYSLENNDSYVNLLTVMLEFIFPLCNNTRSLNLRSKFLNCLSKMYTVKPQVINIEIYTELICKMECKMDEFFILFMQYLSQQPNKKESVVRCLLDGFAFRMEIYAQKSQLTLIEKNFITNCYTSIAKALKQGQRNNWPLMVLKQYELLIDYLLLFTNKNLHPLKLADVLNALIQIYVQSNISNPEKFRFILSLYKHIIIKSSCLFTFIITNYLADQAEFLLWFVQTELSMDKAQEVVEVYFSNQFSVQFLLVIVIYYLHQYPSKIQDMASLMRVINLLQESKYFLQVTIVRQYLQIFHGMIHEQEVFEDFINRVEDCANRLPQ